MNITERLTIRLMQHDDIESARLLHNDDSVLENLSDPSHITEAQQEAWFDNLSKNRSSYRYVVYETWRDGGDNIVVRPEYFVGTFRVDALDHKNKNVMVGMDIVKHHRGKGYAKETYKYFLDYFFNTCGMRRVYLFVLDTNPHARKLYEKLGFIEEGKQRQSVFRHGEYIDCTMMSILNNEYK